MVNLTEGPLSQKNRLDLAMARVDRLMARASKIMERESVNKCRNCGESLGHLSNAGLVIESGSDKFCSEFCLEVFLDSMN